MQSLIAAMLSNIFDPATPLITYVGALLILSFSILWFLDRGNVLRSDALLAVCSALIALILIPNFRAIDFWLSLALVILAVAVLAWMMVKSRAAPTGVEKWKIGAVIAFIISVNTLLFWNYYENNLYGVTINAMLHTEIPPKESGGQSNDSLISALWEKDIVATFKNKYGATVRIKGVNPDSTERLKEFQRLLNSPPQSVSSDKVQANDIDVFAIDVIWPRLLAEHAEDLKPVFKNDLQRFIPAIVENNTVKDNRNNEKLVAVPWYIDVGLLFYRKDLLSKYGEKPPETWNDLERIARKIQDGERADGNSDFWGFVWQGKADEGLTCSALEWQTSHSGGTIVDKDNEVDIKPAAVTAFDRAKNWIWANSISPPDTTSYGQREILDIWNQHNAAFMRHWPYAYRASLVRDSLVQEAEIGVTLLPKGNINGSRHTSTLGGWQLMVNTHSKGRKKKAAIKFVEFLSKDMQELSAPGDLPAPLSLVTETGKLPALIELYDHPEVRTALPFVDVYALKDLFTQDSLVNSEVQIVQRPSTITGKNYDDISSTYFNIVHGILKDSFKDTLQAMDTLRDDVQRLLLAKS